MYWIYLIMGLLKEMSKIILKNVLKYFSELYQLATTLSTKTTFLLLSLHASETTLMNSWYARRVMSSQISSGLTN